MRIAARVIVIVLALAPTAAQSSNGVEPALTMIAPTTMRPGETVQINLVGLNPGFGAEMCLEPATTLSAFLRTPTASFPVVLVAVSGAPVRVGPREFGVLTYTMTVPDAPDGEAVLTVSLDGREIAAATTVAHDGTSGARDTLAASPALDAFPRTFPGRLSLYQPNYFIYGTGEEPAAKFQLSFKYRVLTFGRGTPDRPCPMLQLAYTQRSLWDIEVESGPFYDTSYMPDLFIESLEPPDTRGGGFSFLGWGMGYRHESNGKDGDDSRAINIAYARAIFGFGTPDAWYLGVAPEVWEYLGSTGNMPDVEDYRGHSKVYLVVGYGSGPSLSWTITPGDGFDHVTHELGGSIPVGLSKLDFGCFIYVQYFDGYTESILDYRHYSQSLRVGISLVR